MLRPQSFMPQPQWFMPLRPQWSMPLRRSSTLPRLFIAPLGLPSVPVGRFGCLCLELSRNQFLLDRSFWLRIGGDEFLRILG